MAAIKAILKQCHIENALTIWTRHATPIPLSHLRLSGPTGKQMVRHIVGEPPACYLVGRDDWADVPGLAKQENGQPLHYYAGTPTMPELWTADDGEPLTWAERAALAEHRGPWDLWVNGRGWAHVNGTGRSGAPFVGLVVSAAFLDVFSAAAVAWRDDEQTWGECPVEYKLDDGSPRVSLDDAKRWESITPSVPEVTP